MAPVRRVARWLLASLLLLVVSLGLLGLDRLHPPQLDQVKHLSREIRDPTGRVVHVVPAAGGVWRFAATSGDVAPVYLDLLLATEDRRFWWHAGVDPLALMRAAWQLGANGRVVSGGSTITMQVVRLLEPRPRTLRSKAIEIVRAIQLEAHLGKSGVLDLYLTLAPMGGNLEGVKAGARAWFGREPASLDPAEAALLVALPQRPSVLRPDRDAQQALDARNRILRRGHAQQILDPIEAKAASATPIPRTRHTMPDLLPSVAVAAATEGTTTLQRERSAALRRIAMDTASQVGSRGCAAILVASLASRAIEAVGQACAEGGSAPDLFTALRSPGSALKPFIYAMAFDLGLAAPETRIDDRPRRFGSFAPENFHGGFLGEVPAGDALLLSLNLPAVALLERIGPGVFLASLRAGGARLVLPAGAAPSLPLALGGVGLRLPDLVSLYAALGDGGRAAPLSWTGASPAAGSFLFGERAAADTLSVLLRAPPPPGISRLASNGIAWKTGTSWGHRDAWAAGVNARFAAGVWIGRADGTPILDLLGREAAGPALFRAFELMPTAPLPPRHKLSRAPPALAQFEPSTQARQLRLLFPPDGAELSRDELGLVLRAEGGRRPMRWLVDGRPLQTTPHRRDAAWRPQEPGFYRVSIVDADGASASVSVRIR